MTPPPTFPTRLGNLCNEAWQPFQRGFPKRFGNLSKEGWQDFQRGLDPKGVGRSLLVKYDVQRGLERLPKRLGKITKEAWQDYQRGLARLPKRLGKITKEAWKTSLGVPYEYYKQTKHVFVYLSVSSSLSLLTYSCVSILKMQWLSSSHILVQHGESHDTLQ